MPQHQPQPNPISRLTLHSQNTDLYPATHTILHATTIKLWELTSPQPFSYEIFKVPCSMLVKEVIARLGGGEKGCITECLELGGGRWGKGRAVQAEAKAGKERCDGVGWGEGRGEWGEPVWVVVEK